MNAPDAAGAQERREECRRDVLAFLAVRQAVASHPKTILRGLNAGHEHDYALDEISAALAFLTATEPPLVAGLVEKLGATKYYQATAAGVLTHERQ